MRKVIPLPHVSQFSLCTARINFCSSNLTKIFLIVYFSQNLSEQDWRGLLLPPVAEKICKLLIKWGTPMPTLSQLCPGGTGGWIGLILSGSVMWL